MAEKPKVYIETTVISYLTAWPSAEIVTAAHQRITQDWWDLRRGAFDLYVSELVRQEASSGDPQAAERRLKIIDLLPSLTSSADTRRLASILAQELRLPKQAVADAAHIAISITNGMHYLLTWNCRHIANARLRNMIDDICDSVGYAAPTICTPEELMEDLEQ